MYCEYISDFYIKNHRDMQDLLTKLDDFLMFTNLLGISSKVGTSGATVVCPPPGSTCSDHPKNNFRSSVLSPSPLHRGSPMKELIAID